jgi:hypothetical protein
MSFGRWGGESVVSGGVNGISGGVGGGWAGVSGGRAKVGLWGVLMIGEGVRSDKLLLLAIWYEVDRRGKKRIDVKITRRKNGPPNRVSSVFIGGPGMRTAFLLLGYVLVAGV